MEANCVDLGLVEDKEPDMSLDEIKDIAVQYQGLTEHAHTLLEQGQVEDRLLTGSNSHKYLKVKGHRALTKEDIESIINALGTEAERKAIPVFSQAQIDLTERLKNTQHIGLIMQQADINYNSQYYKRVTRPDLWKPEQIIRVIEVLQRLRL